MTPLKRQLLGSTSPMVHDPATVGTALMTALGAGSAAATVVAFNVTVGAIVGYLAISTITSLALRALTPKPDMSSSRGLLTNGIDGTAVQHYVYGQVRKGGTVTFYEATGTNNKFLHMIICLAGHEVQEIGSIYINDSVVTLDGSGFVTSAPWNSKIRIKKHLGSETQVVDPDLDSETSATASFRGRGIAYIYARLEYDQDVFTNGIPSITAVVKGKKVYDPRTGTTVWSSNAALCVRDYLTDARGLADTGIDDTMLAVAANVCDESVALATGGSEKRYAMNGVIQSDVQPGSALQQMMTACAGTLFWGQGAWKLKPGYYTPPVKTFTLADLRSSISLQTRQSMSDVFNAVQGTFNNAAQDWITVDYPKLTGSTFVTEDGGVESAIDLELPMTTSSATAQRISKMALYRGREQMTFSADFGLAALEVQVGDIVAMTNERYGWAAKEFEVTGWRFFNDEEGMRVNMTLRETSEAAFDWNADESELAANNTTLPDPWEVPGIGIALVTTPRVIYEKLTNTVTANVTTATGAYVERVEVQFKASGDTDWKVVGVGSPGKYEVVDVGDGLYDFRARAYNQFGVRGSWEYYYSFQVAGLADPPQNVAGLHAYVSGGTIVLEWQAVADLDLSHYIVRYAIEETGATFANATTAVEKVSRPATSVIMPARPGTYMIRAVDKTGNMSPTYTSVVVTAAAFEQFANTLSLTDSPTFTGTKTNCSVVSSQLRITSGLSGTYDFSTYIDTGAARRIRARTDVTLVRYDPSLGLFDALPGLFDALPGMFDDFTGGSNYSDTDVVTYIRSTNDNPAGTPTWSDWTIYKGGDFYGRAFQFKVDLVSTTSGVTPGISGLTARVWYN
jgi:hypothetical protein